VSDTTAPAPRRSPVRWSVIQRHSNERTRDAGLSTISREFADAEVVQVAAGDFPTTLRRCFESAVDIGNPWTVTIDGDVLLLPGAGVTLAVLARRMSRSAGHADVLVHDKVTGEARSAGVRLYRTSVMARALDHGDWSGRERPETQLLASLEDVVAWSPAVLVGLHDHEQYLHDLFRTAFIMARKKSHRIAAFRERWSALQADTDFVALLAGAEAAERPELPTSFASEDYRSLSDEFLATSGLTEKPPLHPIPSWHELEAQVPPAAHLLRRPNLGARRLPAVWRKAGNGTRGLALARYALRRGFEHLRS